jgi:hypothetical protein
MSVQGIASQRIAKQNLEGNQGATVETFACGRGCGPNVVLLDSILMGMTDDLLETAMEQVDAVCLLITSARRMSILSAQSSILFTPWLASSQAVHHDHPVASDPDRAP